MFARHSANSFKVYFKTKTKLHLTHVEITPAWESHHNNQSHGGMLLCAVKDMTADHKSTYFEGNLWKQPVRSTEV